MFEDAFVFLNQRDPFFLECMIRLREIDEMKNKRKKMNRRWFLNNNTLYILI